MDGFDPVGSSEPQGVLLFHPDCISFQLTGDLRNQIDGLGRYGERWFVHGLFRHLVPPVIPTFIPTQRYCLFRHKQKEDKSFDLSSLVEQVLEISNEFIERFKAVIGFRLIRSDK